MAVSVLYLFHVVLWVGLQCVIGAFTDCILTNILVAIGDCYSC